ncbi:hypothetical protein HMN09_00274900 [Mycena chlorophos]|uniref:Uncharacterized protein n=1 Tax=Mycena chlorophos TaxID=658473 RepID=A0A8H6TI59_MYCCL|nr:hypothetical protein HMN09_00274900 [Mycena chlorophos]
MSPPLVAYNPPILHWSALKSAHKQPRTTIFCLLAQAFSGRRIPPSNTESKTWPPVEQTRPHVANSLMRPAYTTFFATPLNMLRSYHLIVSATANPECSLLVPLHLVSYSVIVLSFPASVRSIVVRFRRRIHRGMRCVMPFGNSAAFVSFPSDELVSRMHLFIGECSSTPLQSLTVARSTLHLILHPSPLSIAPPRVPTSDPRRVTTNLPFLGALVYTFERYLRVFGLTASQFRIQTCEEEFSRNFTTGADALSGTKFSAFARVFEVRDRAGLDIEANLGADRRDKLNALMRLASALATDNPNISECASLPIPNGAVVATCPAFVNAIFPREYRFILDLQQHRDNIEGDPALPAEFKTDYEFFLRCMSEIAPVTTFGVKAYVWELNGLVDRLWKTFDRSFGFNGFQSASASEHSSHTTLFVVDRRHGAPPPFVHAGACILSYEDQLVDLLGDDLPVGSPEPMPAGACGGRLAVLKQQGVELAELQELVRQQPPNAITTKMFTPNMDVRFSVVIGPPTFCVFERATVVLDNGREGMALLASPVHSMAACDLEPGPAPETLLAVWFALSIPDHDFVVAGKTIRGVPFPPLVDIATLLSPDSFRALKERISAEWEGEHGRPPSIVDAPGLDSPLIVGPPSHISLTFSDARVVRHLRRISLKHLQTRDFSVSSSEPGDSMPIHRGDLVLTSLVARPKITSMYRGTLRIAGNHDAPVPIIFKVYPTPHMSTLITELSAYEKLQHLAVVPVCYGAFVLDTRARTSAAATGMDVSWAGLILEDPDGVRWNSWDALPMHDCLAIYDTFQQIHRAGIRFGYPTADDVARRDGRWYCAHLERSSGHECVGGSCEELSDLLRRLKI